jgi:hypothetical protein
VELGFFYKIEDGVSSDLEVFAWLLNVRDGLAVGVEGSDPVKLLIESINDGLVKMVHVLLCLGG